MNLTPNEISIIIKALECFESIGHGRIEHIEHLYKEDKRYDGYGNVKPEFKKLRRKLLNSDSTLTAQINTPDIYKVAIKIKNKMIQDLENIRP